MLKIGFGGRAKPRTFDYIPRYYDPVKEELDERLRKYDAMYGDQPVNRDPNDISQMAERIKSNLRKKHYGDPNYRKQEVRASNLRLISIIVTLSLVAYVLLGSNKVTDLISLFSG